MKKFKVWGILIIGIIMLYLFFCLFLSFIVILLLPFRYFSFYL